MMRRCLLTTTALAAAASVAALGAVAAPAQAAGPAFTASSSTTLASPAPAGVAFDVNGDGVMDTAHIVSPSAAVVRTSTPGVGTGFTETTLPVDDFYTLTKLASGDFNGDGRADLVAVGWVTGLPTTGVIRWYLSDPTAPGGFTARTRTTPNRSQLDVAAADIDDDGRTEAVTSGRQGGNSFISSTKLTSDTGVNVHSASIGASTGPMPVVADDFDRDGLIDGAVGVAGKIVIVHGSGRSHQTSALPVWGWIQEISTSGTPSSLTSGDLDGDGRPDLIARTTDHLETWRSPAPGDPATATATTSYDVLGEGPIAVGDFDRDDRIDVIVASGSTLKVFSGNSNGTLGAAVNVSPSIEEPGRFIAVGDYDADGTPDLFVGAGTTVSRLGGPSVSRPHRSAIISELRTRGPWGDADQFVQLHNPGETPLAIGGWKLRTSDGRTVNLPQGVVIPAAGHLLAGTASTANNGYSMGNSSGRSTIALPFGRSFSDPSGHLALAPTASGVAIVDPFGTTQDAVGTTGAPEGYSSGTALTSFTARDQFAFVRRYRAGHPVNTGNNAADFVAVENLADGSGAAILGAPRPDSLSSPTMKNAFLQSSLVDPAKAASAVPNREFTPAFSYVPAQLTINRTITNCSGAGKAAAPAACVNAADVDGVTVTKLRFRVTALSTVGNAGTGAVLRTTNGFDFSTGGVDLRGLPLDAPSDSYTGGGLNSTLTATQLIPAGLAPGASINVAFRFNVDRPGAFTFGFNTEDDLVEGDAVPAAEPVPPRFPETTSEDAVVLPDRVVSPTPVLSATPAPEPTVTAPAPPAPIVQPTEPAAKAAEPEASEVVHGVIPASALVAAPVTGSVAAPASAKPAASPTKAAPAKSKKATCKVAKRAKSKGKAQSKKSTKPCATKGKTTKKSTKAKTPKKTATEVASKK